MSPTEKKQKAERAKREEERRARKDKWLGIE